MTRHDDVAVRKIFYSFMTRVYGSAADNNGVNSVVHRILVEGLSDRSKKVRSILKSFWNCGSSGSSGSAGSGGSGVKSALPMDGDIIGRLQRLLSKTSERTTGGGGAGGGTSGLYHFKAEDRWLEYSSFLTIALSENTADYNRYLPGCEDKLQDCEFVEVDVTAGTELLTMQPKYASLVSQISSYAQDASSQYGSGTGGGSQYTFSQLVSQTQDHEDGGVGYVLATQGSSQLRFKATQAGGGQSLAHAQGKTNEWS